MDQEAAIEYIRSLTEAQLASFFETALNHLTDGNLANGLTVFRLAQCFTYQNSNGQCTEPPVIQIVAPPISLAEYSEKRDLDQLGTCSHCQITVCCAAKLAECPICKAEIFCT